ncbi:hypothetical protein BVAVS116_K0023 (plasmid) [Borreliella valaisiana VS116]|uniref:Uncharacterized protein n=1 Tax=Borreliella valaisiana VS116 TaxID=445987 RepID=C0R8L6_BORVA|nr:hypothetical protein BVAVS116_K0023 [Borreliella valaisiana VS116]
MQVLKRIGLGILINCFDFIESTLDQQFKNIKKILILNRIYICVDSIFAIKFFLL